ncbi:MAG: hypothetical protein C0423_01060 [Methylibium sp.]|nr:hypothetical protein [Methylibium sp.]
MAVDAVPQATRWLGEPLEVLLQELAQQQLQQQQPRSEPDFDVLIVGSGYGGATAAEQLSRCADEQGRPLRIAVLERGREYLQGSFPARFAELTGHLRVTTPAGEIKGFGEGLFDLRVGPDMVVALGSGLGGGSLINAGVMEPARPEVFADPAWPEGLRRDPAQMKAWYAAAGRALGSLHADGQPNTIDRLAGFAPRRAELLASLGDAAAPARRVPITVALEAQPQSAAGLDLQRCIACGDCATGCNHGAKQSLDTNLLLQAHQRGVRLITGASVLRLEKDAHTGWQLLVQPSDAVMRRRELAPTRLRARRVLLAAGTLGSSEILLRSRAAGLALSDQLGRRFSGNGDVLAAAVEASEPLQALADEDQAPAARGVGPTITALLDARSGAAADGGNFVVQDLAVPGALRWSFEESFALAETLDRLAQPDRSRHADGVSFDDPLSIRPERSARILPLAIMGLDGASGELRLPAEEDEWDAQPGRLQVHWPGARDDPAVQRRHAWLQARLAQRGARLLANPLWRLLPAELSFLTDDQKGPMITVHPLGGCAMADDAARGVVDEWGRVYAGRQGQAVHEGLVVLDGAIVPAAVGINPALTITALALRALATLRRLWGLRERSDLAALPKPGPRPVFRRLPIDKAEARAPVEAELRERLGGFVRLPGAPGGDTKYLELTLVYQPLPLRQLLQAGPQRRLRCAPDGESRLRLFDAWPDPDAPGHYMVVKAGSARGQGKLWMHAERQDSDARLVLPLQQAELAVFHREASGPWQRSLRGLWAWWRNRGWRDTTQALLDGLSQRVAPKSAQGSRWQRVKTKALNALALASHAGQVRRMDYALLLGEAADIPVWARPLQGLRLAGAKRLSYTRRGNPWTQLSRLTLEVSGPIKPLRGQAAPVLELDLFYLARQRQPLLRITRSPDMPSTVRELGALLAYLLRLLIEVHVWTFRLPDAAPPRTPERLPGAVPGLPQPEVMEIAVGRRGDAGLQRRPVERKPRADADEPVHLRLTRYRQDQRIAPAGHDGPWAGGQPLLMIHGYSASGATFAHHSVQPGPAKLLWDAGFDVWLLDLRTSAGMPSATLPWTFEECALNDIPVAVDQVLRATGRPQLDLFAHCMGASMLHMALLQPREQAGVEHFFPLRQRLMQGGLIRRLVISQVTPKMIMSPTNTLRAHLMQYLRPWLPLQDFAFRPEEPRGLQDQLIDRLLSSLPYPEAEFDLENPPFPSLRRTPWTATRHRMDLLYGRDFALGNVAAPVLDFIDDHFGPLNMDTVAQAINFARVNEITDWRGASVYLDDMAKTLAQLQAFPVLSIHGQDNGLCQAESGELLQDLYEQIAPGRYRYKIIHGHGHQDCLIGHDIREKVFVHVLQFLFEEPQP